MIDIVIFDLDSTLVSIEGMDWLAERKGLGAQMAKITLLSMNGEMPVNAAFKFKMAAIRPSCLDFAELGQKYCKSLVPKAKETIAKLQALGKQIFIVTGNFEPAAFEVGKTLNILEENIFANKVFFDSKGTFKSFDEESPLAKNGGKAQIVEGIKRKHPGKKIAFVGDGITDLETSISADLFIGFGGVVERERVKREAKYFAKSFDEVLKIILNF